MLSIEIARKIFESITVGAGLCLILFGSAVRAEDVNRSQTEVVPYSVDVNYVPEVLNQNSNAYIVVGGMFPSGCYSWHTAEVTHVNIYEHEVRSFANEFMGFCTQSLIPFSKTVSFGNLIAGKHLVKIFQAGGEIVEINLNVAE